MKPILCAVLLMCACSRSSLKAIEHMAVADASPPVDSRPPVDTNSPDSHPPVDTSPPDMRLPDTNPPDMRPIDTRPLIDSRPSDTFVAIDTRPTDTAPACPTTVPPQDGSNQTVMGRNYVLHIPKNYDGSRPVPLLFDFHMLGVFDGKTQSNISSYPGQTDADSAIVAFPTGSPGPLWPAWNLGPCCVTDSRVDDVAFTKAMIAQIQKLVCIDSSRIYAVGSYTGGGMAYLLACRAADIFAGVAVSAWDLLSETVADCKPTRGITVVSFRATGDGLAPYGGGSSEGVKDMPITFLGAKATFAKWSTIDSCTVGPRDDGNGCSRYSSCRDGAEVVLCTKNGTGPEASDAAVAWPLLKQHALQ